MKNIQNWKKFNESHNQEIINEGLIGDLIKLPFKIIGFLLKPLVPLLLKVIGKSISIENKWKITKAILDNVAKLALDVEEAKKKLAKESSDLTPNERRELEKKVDKFKKEYPNGFKFSEVKKKLVESLEKNFAKATDEKKKEDLEWLLKKISEYKISNYTTKGSSYKLEILDDLIVESVNESDEELSPAEKTAISNFPHKAKEDAEKREKRIRRSQKEDPDGMYPRDDKRYDDSDSKGGWQDGMGKPSWLGEGVAEKSVRTKDKHTEVKADKKDSFRKKLKDIIESNKDCKTKQVGDDLEIHCCDEHIAQVMFRSDYVGVKKVGNKFPKEFGYEELGKIKAEISSIIKSCK
jgi:hypothetical protein